MINIKFNSVTGSLTINSDITDNELKKYIGKVLLFPYIYDDGECVLKFSYLERNIVHDFKNYAHLISNINFEHFLKYIITNINKDNQELLYSIQTYLNAINTDIGSFNNNKLCPCCNAPLFRDDNSEYCVNGDCSQFNFINTLANKLSIITSTQITNEIVEELIKNIISSDNSFPSYEVVNMLNETGLINILSNVIKILPREHNFRKLLINSITNLTINQIFQLFKCPNILQDDINNYCNNNIVFKNFNSEDLLSILPDTIYKAIGSEEQIHPISIVDSYIKHSIMINNNLLLGLQMLIKKLNN